MCIFIQIAPLTFFVVRISSIYCRWTDFSNDTRKVSSERVKKLQEKISKFCVEQLRLNMLESFRCCIDDVVPCMKNLVELAKLGMH